MIALHKPKVILCSIENINDPDIQRNIQDLEVEYVAVDEAQVKFTVFRAIHSYLLI